MADIPIRSARGIPPPQVPVPLSEGPDISLAALRAGKNLPLPVVVAEDDEGVALVETVDPVAEVPPARPSGVTVNLTELLDKQVADLEKEVAEKTAQLTALKAMQQFVQSAGVPITFDGQSFGLAKGK